MIGARLKAARRVRNLTLKDVAARAKSSEGHISKVENDKVEPSLTLLHRITRALEINMAFLFDEGGQPATPVSRAGGRPLLDLDPVRDTRRLVLERIVPHSDDHLLQCNIHIVEPGGASEGQINHLGEEVGYVLEGEIELTLEEDVYVLQTGDAFHFKSHLRHGYRNLGTRRARILWTNTPPTF